MTAGSTSTVFEYDALRDSLTHAGAVLTLPELHGGICGALCATGPPAAQRWLDDALADQSLEQHAAADLKPLQESLRALVRASWQMLDGSEISFEPLLPDDDTPLEEQVQALATWCHGFLSAFGLSAPDAARGSARERAAQPADGAGGIGEILTDFAEISRAGLTDEDTSDRDQAGFALAELKEYLRVSVQIVFEDLRPRRAAAGREVH